MQESRHGMKTIGSALTHPYPFGLLYCNHIGRCNRVPGGYRTRGSQHEDEAVCLSQLAAFSFVKGICEFLRGPSLEHHQFFFKVLLPRE